MLIVNHGIRDTLEKYTVFCNGLIEDARFFFLKVFSETSALTNTYYICNCKWAINHTMYLFKKERFWVETSVSTVCLILAGHSLRKLKETMKSVRQVNFYKNHLIHSKIPHQNWSQKSFCVLFRLVQILFCLNGTWHL